MNHQLLIPRRRSSLWSPLSITSETGGMWLKSSDGIYDATSGGSAVTVSGNVVKRWEDQSGNGNHVTQATTGKAMKFRSDSIGGLPSIATDWTALAGVPRFFNFPAGLSFNRRNFSMFFIVRSFHTVTQTYFNGGSLYDLMLDLEPANLRNFLVTGPSANNFTTLKVSCNPLLIGTIGRAGSSTGYMGTLSEAGAALDSGTVTGGVLGAEVNEAYPIGAELYEVIYVSREITAGEVAQLRSYAAANYGPQSFDKVLVCEGDSLTEGAYCTIGKNWVTQLGDSIGTSWQLFNYGASGATVATMNAQRVAQIESRLAGSETTKQTAMLAGFNDYHTSGLTGAQFDTASATWHAGVRGAGSQKSYVFTTPANAFATWDAGMETARTDGNTLIRAKYNGASYGGPGNALVDLAADARFQDPNDATYYHTDKLHFTNAGFAAIAELLEAQM